MWGIQSNTKTGSQADATKDKASQTLMSTSLRLSVSDVSDPPFQMEASACDPPESFFRNSSPIIYVLFVSNVDNKANQLACTLPFFFSEIPHK